MLFNCYCYFNFHQLLLHLRVHIVARAPTKSSPKPLPSVRRTYRTSMECYGMQCQVAEYCNFMQAFLPRAFPAGFFAIFPLTLVEHEDTQRLVEPQLTEMEQV